MKKFLTGYVCINVTTGNLTGDPPLFLIILLA